ncbi:MAG: hypothetical protein AAF580_14325 [Pseudomonadota bacterium]
MLRLVEAISDPGSTTKPNEDGYGTAGRFAWIIDGATGLADAPLLDAPSDAAWLTARINAAFEELSATHIDPSVLMRSAADRVSAEFASQCLRAPEERYETPTAAVLLAHFGTVVTVCDVGDCGLYIDAGPRIIRFGGTAAGKALEQRNASQYMASGKGRTQEVMAFLRRVRNLANTPKGYAIFAPGADWTDRARVHMHRSSAGTALFMTDGFEAAEEDYGLYDRAGLMAAAKADISVPIKAVREAEAADPDCTRFPRFKPSDDATAMVVQYGA